MFLPSWLGLLRRVLRPSPSGRPPAHRRATSRRLRPNIELLETRNLLSNYSAATVADLIADINAANQQSGVNTITLVAPTTSAYVLTAVDNTTDGATGLPVIAANDNLSIVGNGDVIQRSTGAGTPAFRLFDVAGGASLTLQTVTLQGGLAFGGGASAEGGAMYNQGTVDLSGVTVQNNIAQGNSGASGQAGQTAAGGGIYSSGALTLEGSTHVQHNQALGGVGGAGRVGRYSNDFRATPGGAGGDGLGGGVYLAGGTITVTSASLSANAARGGQGGAGGAYDDRFPRSGGAGGNGLGGGLYAAGGTLNLTSAALSANTAQGGQGGAGGNEQSSLLIGGQGGAGGNGFGGGLHLAGGMITLRNDTVTSNAAHGGQGGRGGAGSPRGSTGHPGLGEGGGLYIDLAAAVCLDAFTQAHVSQNSASTSDPNVRGSWTPC